MKERSGNAIARLGPLPLLFPDVDQQMISARQAQPPTF